MALIFVFATGRGGDVNISLSVGLHAEKFNIVSNDHGCMQIQWQCSLFHLHQKYPFRADLVPKFKIASTT